jgi:hypothetical protein
MERPKRRFLLSAVLFAAVSLTRAEGVFFGLGAAIVHVLLAWRRRERLLAQGTLLFPLIVLGAIAAYESWRFAYYGPHLFPNSVRVKIGGGLGHALRGFTYVAKEFLAPYVLLLAPMVTPGLWRRPVLASGFAMFVGSVVFIALAGGDWTSGRLFAPVLPLGMVVLIGWLATTPLPARCAATPLRRRCTAIAAIVYVAFTFVVTSLLREAPFRRGIAAGDAERIAIGVWLAENLPPDALLAVNAAGVIPYYSRLRTHDMYGLTDAHISSLPLSDLRHDAPGHERFDANYTLSLQPDVIVDPRQIPSLVRNAMYLNSYQVVEHFWKYHQLAFHRRLLQRLGRGGDVPKAERAP